MNLVENDQRPLVLLQKKPGLRELGSVLLRLHVEVEGAGPLVGDVQRERGLTDLPRADDRRNSLDTEGLAQVRRCCPLNHPCILKS